MNYIGMQFAQALSVAMNQASDSSPSIQELVDKLEGKAIRFELKDLSYAFVLSVTERIVAVETDDESSADLVVRTTLPKLVKLASAKSLDPAQLDDVEINGDVKLLQQLYAIFQDLQFDWEEELSKRIGDIFARQVGNLFRWGQRQTSSLRTSLSDNVQQKLVDDQYLVPTRTQVEQYLDDVDDLQADLDRLEKRIERLERRANP